VNEDALAKKGKGAGRYLNLFLTTGLAKNMHRECLTKIYKTCCRKIRFCRKQKKKKDERRRFGEKVARKTGEYGCRKNTTEFTP